MTEKVIKIHPQNAIFVSLMKEAVQAIREENQILLDKVKAEFAEANINLFYNKETDIIRVLLKDSPPIDFSASRFEVK